VVKATLNGLMALRDPDTIARMRGVQALEVEA
jgi:ribosomal protein S5